MIEINPEEFNIHSASRLVIYNSSIRKFHQFINIPFGEVYIIDDEEILNNLTDFKYKLQVNNDSKWVDETKYLKFYDDKILEKLFTDKIKITHDEFKNILDNYWNNHSENYIPEIRSAFANGMRNIWMNSKSRHPNLLTMIQISKELKYELPLLWKNIIFYINEILELKLILTEMNFLQIRYNRLNSELISRESEIYKCIENRLYKLEETDLEFSKLITGLYYSYIGERQKALEAFEEAHNYKEKFIHKMKIDMGSYTYNMINSHTEYNPKIYFPTDLKPDNSTLTILVSMDSAFLKYYAVQLFYTMIALKKYHFHFHIIGNPETSKSIIKDAEDLFHNIHDFMAPKNKIITPSFSYEEPPTFVHDLKTYYACARFVSAENIMRSLNNDVLIMDADLFVFDEIDSYVEKLIQHDVAIPFSTSLMSLYPWRRIMAGNVYLKNNENAISFIHIVKNYIISHIDKENSWTLDQNALTYAYENITQNINLGDSAIYYRPMSQPALRKLIEQN